MNCVYYDQPINELLTGEYDLCCLLYPRSEWTTAGEADKIEQICGNVLTYTRHKEQLNTSAFDRKSLSGVWRWIDNNKKEGISEPASQWTFYTNCVYYDQPINKHLTWGQWLMWFIMTSQSVNFLLDNQSLRHNEGGTRHIFSDSSPASSLAVSQCTPLPGSFVLLQTAGRFTPPC